MNIRILCVGKLKESYWRDAAAEYMKRLSRYCNIFIEEVKEEKLPDNASPAEEEKGKQAEGERILSKIKENEYVIALDIKGLAESSEVFAERLDNLALDGRSDLVFLIGGSNGLSGGVLSRAQLKLSFSKMTFPHQLMRVILLEQIYRVFKIIRGENYHK